MEIRNRLGLHLRAATTLAQTAAKFKSTDHRRRAARTGQARSVTALIMLGAGKGTKLDSGRGRGRAGGDGRIDQLFNNGFGEE